MFLMSTDCLGASFRTLRKFYLKIQSLKGIKQNFLKTILMIALACKQPRETQNANGFHFAVKNLKPEPLLFKPPNSEAFKIKAFVLPTYHILRFCKMFYFQLTLFQTLAFSIVTKKTTKTKKSNKQDTTTDQIAFEVFQMNKSDTIFSQTDLQRHCPQFLNPHWQTELFPSQLSRKAIHNAKEIR